MINGNASATLVVGDDRGQNPNSQVSIKMTQNTFPTGLQYYWIDPSTKSSTLLNLNSSVQIAALTDDSKLPAWIKMSGAGTWYTMSLTTDTGLEIKANNTLLTQNNTNAGTFQYTIASGPA